MLQLATPQRALALLLAAALYVLCAPAFANNAEQTMRKLGMCQ